MGLGRIVQGKLNIFDMPPVGVAVVVNFLNAAGCVDQVGACGNFVRG
jgi:hypothetical protein